MDLTSQRIQYRSDGIFSRVSRDDTNAQILTTLEHAYPSGLPEFTWLPKIMPGVYDCIRGLHRLDHMTDDFETFEIIGIPGHSGLLWHWGNWNRDSDGCILTGDDIVEGSKDYDHVDGHDDLVTNSQVAFARFMQLQFGVQRFRLTIVA